MRWNYTSSMFQADDDPLNTGILDQTTARALFDLSVGIPLTSQVLAWAIDTASHRAVVPHHVHESGYKLTSQSFIEHCHPFLPIINVALDDTFAAIRQSASLFSAVLAVAARFYRNYNNRRPSENPPLESSCPQRLANLAEAHLGHTLLRRQLAQSDVQASLLLAAWNLHEDGTSGPDAWVVTGHAARISRRLGVHKVLAHAAETSRESQPGSSAWHLLQISMPSWRTWLCWFTFDGFLSLGFGRPQSTQFETVDESGFLKMRLEQCPLWPRSSATLSLNGDVYIASQVQLTQIARDLINWSEMLADPDQAVYSDPRRASIFTEKILSFETMSKELNQRLDEWGKIWVWPSKRQLLPEVKVANPRQTLLMGPISDPRPEWPACSWNIFGCV